MPATATQAVLDTPAAEFRLPATDGKTYALDDVAGEKGTVVVPVFARASSHRLAYPITSSASTGVRLGPLRGA